MQKRSLFEHYVAAAVDIIYHYDGAIPLQYVLRQHFAQHTRYGSRDRKLITSLCYAYFRLGKSVPDIEVKEKMLLAFFLCNNQSSLLLENLAPELNNAIGLPLAEKLTFLPASFTVNDLFPFAAQSSGGLDIGDFALSMLVQPDVFLRIRPGKGKRVLRQLEDHKVTYTLFADDCIALPAATKVDELLALNRDVVIQDRSSQQVGTFLGAIKDSFAGKQPEVWDCCAASGGKSILAVDVLRHINLTVSDIRASILQNLSARFKQAGIVRYNAFVADLCTGENLPAVSAFDLVICDAPCSGSGTWARTPEQGYFFEAEKIAYYANLQRSIVNNIIPSIKSGGYLLYITCSVFREENEAIAKHIKNHHMLVPVKEALLTGYSYKADTMFAALFQKQG